MALLFIDAYACGALLIKSTTVQGLSHKEKDKD